MPSNSSRIPARLIIVAGSIFALVLIVHFAGIALLHHFVERTLHPALPKGTYIGEVHLNLFTGALTVHDFELRDDSGVRMRAGELSVAISPWRMLGGHVHVREAALSNAYVRVERHEDGTFDVGLPPFGSDAPAADADASPPPVSLAGARLQRVQIDYRDGELASTLYIDDLKVGAYSARAEEQQVPLQWQLRWDDRTVGGDARVALAQGQVAAEGRLQAVPLDLTLAQRLARLEPVIDGELGIAASFTWQAPRLAMQGSLEAPQLAYAIAGREARLDGLRLPDFALNVTTGPSIDVELSLRDGSRIAASHTQFAGQMLTSDDMRLTGTLRYTDGDAIALDGLALAVQSLTWEGGGRRANAEALTVSGRLLQNITGVDPFPSTAAQVAAERVRFADPAAATELQITGLKLADLQLAPTDEAGARSLSGTLAVGSAHVTQADTVVEWRDLAASLGGRVNRAGGRVAADLQLAGLRVAHPTLADGPLSVASVEVKALDIGPESSFGQLRLASIDLPAEVPETALQVAALELGEGRYTPDGVSIGDIVVDGLQTGIVRDEAGAWRYVTSRPAPVGRTAEQEAKAEPADEAAPAGVEAKGGEAGEAFGWRLGGLRVTGDSHITVADHLNPDMQPIRYAIERIEIGGLASADPGRTTPFDIRLRPDAYSEFVFSGDIRPLADRIFIDARGHVHGFGMPSVNGLVANDLGHRFLDGQLDNDFTIRIEEQRLEMTNELALAGLAVEEIQGKEGPPLATAIALLEDRDGNIKLQVPVAGDLGDPQFRVLGALNPIIMKAVAGTAALAIQPLGSVLLVGGLLADQALKVTFEPALFAPGTDKLDAAAGKYLDQLAGKLAEKPKLAVRVCGVVAESERRKDKQGKYLDPESEVLALAQRRADAARARMISAGAGERQLRVCRPSIDPAPEARPRVDIKF